MLITRFALQKKQNPDIKGLRTKVWTHGHLRKDGKPINEAVAETLVCVLFQISYYITLKMVVLYHMLV
jgi:hypothetical protein